MTRSEAMILLLGLTGLVLAGWLLLARRHHDKIAEQAMPVYRPFEVAHDKPRKVG